MSAVFWEKTGRTSCHLLVLVTLIVLFLLFYYSFDFVRITTISYIPWIREMMAFEFFHDINGSLLYIPIIYAVLVFTWERALLIWLVSVAALMPHILSFSNDTFSVLFNIIFLLIPILIMLFITAELKWKEKERTAMMDWKELEQKALQEREREREQHMTQIFKAQEDERKRIAQELHDDTTPTLLVIASKAENILSNTSVLQPGELQEHVQWIRDNILQVSNDIRRISVDLRPGILDHLGLIPAIRWLIDRIGENNPVDVSLEITGESWNCEPDCNAHIYRIVQEALNNVRTHSEATGATVALEYTENELTVTITDNGRGFSLNSVMPDVAGRNSIGIIGMQERAKFINGKITINSELNIGTSVILSVARCRQGDGCGYPIK